MNEKGKYSNWSDRHIAFAAGLGTFRLSDGLITERGLCHNCGSVFTYLALTPNPRETEDHYGDCLFYQRINCKGCIERCPVGAITEKGHNKLKCSGNVDTLEAELLSGIYDNDTTIEVSAFA